MSYLALQSFTANGVSVSKGQSLDEETLGRIKDCLEDLEKHGCLKFNGDKAAASQAQSFGEDAKGEVKKPLPASSKKKAKAESAAEGK